MTSRQLYEGLLIELNKVNAPNILLEDFNYFANKAINQYINKRYNIYDINQQTTDDLRVLKATAILKPKRLKTYDALSLVNNKMATYYVDLPSDYLHLLNCICIYNVNKTYKCYNKGETWRAAATRLTADAYSQVLDNFWLRPTYKRPYYYIHNINMLSDGENYTQETIPTNPYRIDSEGRILGTDSNLGEASDYHGYYENTGNDEDSGGGSGNGGGGIPSGNGDGTDSNGGKNDETKTITLQLLFDGHEARNTTITYGDNVPVISYACNDNTILGDYKPQIFYDSALLNAPKVGTYEVTINRGNIPSNINVNFSTQKASIIVDQAEIGAILKTNKDYYSGEPLPTFTRDDIELTGLKYGQEKNEVIKNNAGIYINNTLIETESKNYYKVYIRSQSLGNYKISQDLYIGDLIVKTRKPVEEKLTITVPNVTKTYGSINKNDISYSVTNGELNLENPYNSIFKVIDQYGIERDIDSSLHAGVYSIILNSSNIKNTDYLLTNGSGGNPTLTITKATISIRIKSVSMETDDILSINTQQEKYIITQGHSEGTKEYTDIFTYRGFVNNHTKATVIKQNPTFKLDGSPVTGNISKTVGTYTLSLDTTGILVDQYSNDYEISSGTSTIMVFSDSYNVSTYIDIDDKTCKAGQNPTLTYREVANPEVDSSVHITSGNGNIELAVYNGNTRVSDITSLEPGTYSIRLDGNSSQDTSSIQVVNEGVLTVEKALLRISLTDSFENDCLQIPISEANGKNPSEFVTINYLASKDFDLIHYGNSITVPKDGNNNPLVSGSLKILKISKSNIGTSADALLGDYTINFGGFTSTYYDLSYGTVLLSIVPDTILDFPEYDETLGEDFHTEEYKFKYTKVAVPRDFIYYGAAHGRRNYTFELWYFDNFEKPVYDSESNYVSGGGNYYFKPGKDGKVALTEPNSSKIFSDIDGNPRFINFAANRSVGIGIYSIQYVTINNGRVDFDKVDSTEHEKIVYENGAPKIEVKYKVNGKEYTPSESDILEGHRIYEVIGQSKVDENGNPLATYDLRLYIEYNNSGTKRYMLWNNQAGTTRYYDADEIDYQGNPTKINGEKVKAAIYIDSIDLPEKSHYYYYKLDKNGGSTGFNSKGESLQDILNDDEYGSFISFLKLRPIASGKGVGEEITNPSYWPDNFVYGAWTREWSEKKGNYINVSHDNWTITIKTSSNRTVNFNCEKGGKNVLKLGNDSGFRIRNNFDEYNFDENGLPYYQLVVPGGQFEDIISVETDYTIIDDYLLNGYISTGTTITNEKDNTTTVVDGLGPFYPEQVWIPGFPSFTMYLQNDEDKSKQAALQDYEKIFEIYRRTRKATDKEKRAGLSKPLIVYNNGSEITIDSIVEFGYWKRNSESWKILGKFNGKSSTITVGEDLEDLRITASVDHFEPSTFVKIENFPPANCRCKFPGTHSYYINPTNNEKVSPFEEEKYPNSDLKTWEKVVEKNLGPADYGWEWRWNNNSSGQWCNRCGYWNYLSIDDDFVITTDTNNKEIKCYSPASTLEPDCDCIEETIIHPSPHHSPSIDPEVSEGISIVQGITPPNFIKINDDLAISNVERGQGIRYGNVSRVRLEIRYGTDSSIFSLDYEQGRPGGLIYIDYLKVPQHIRLTQYELDLTEDTSQVLEYPDYVCQEIINELTHIVMENQGDPKLQTHPVVSQSIANPAQTQAPEAAGQSAQ